MDTFYINALEGIDKRWKNANDTWWNTAKYKLNLAIDMAKDMNSMMAKLEGKLSKDHTHLSSESHYSDSRKLEILNSNSTFGNRGQVNNIVRPLYTIIDSKLFYIWELRTRDNGFIYKYSTLLLRFYKYNGYYLNNYVKNNLCLEFQMRTNWTYLNTCQETRNYVKWLRKCTVPAPI